MFADVKIDFEKLRGRLSDVKIAEGFYSGMRLLKKAIQSREMEREVSQKIGRLEPTSWNRVKAQLRKCFVKLPLPPS